MRVTERNQLKMGVLLAYVLLSVNNLSALLYTPFMLRTMGQAEYGLYSLCISFVSFVTILDFGLGNAVIRYVAKYRECGTELEKRQINGMFLMIYSGIGAVALLGGMIIYSFMGDFFGDSLTIAEIYKARVIVIILLINVILSFPLSVFSSILTAYEKFVVVRSLNIIRTLLMPCIMIPLLLIGYRSVAMSIVITVLNIAVLSVSALYCVHALKIKFIFSRIETSVIKEIVDYSIFAFLLLIVDKVNWSAPQVILGKYTSTSDVAVYSVASQISQLYLAFPTAIAGVMLPKLTMMITRQNTEKDVSELFLKISRLQLYIAIYILFGFILVGQDFLAIWAGPGYEISYYIAVILMSSAGIPLSLNIGNVILQAKNMQRFRAVILAIMALLNVLLSIPLAQRYGPVGCTFGTAISYIIGHLFIMTVYYQKKISLNMKTFWSSAVRIITPCVGVLFISIGMNFMMPQVNVMNVFIKCAVYSALFFVCAYAFCANQYERGLIKSVALRIQRKVRNGRFYQD